MSQINFICKTHPLLGISIIKVPVSVKKHSFRNEDMWEVRLSEHKIRGWRAVSVARLQGKGSPPPRKNNIFVIGTGITNTLSCTCVDSYYVTWP